MKMPGWWAVLLLLTIAPACKREPAPTKKAASSGFLPQVVVDEPGLGGIQVDSVYRQITTDAEATPVLGKPQQWMVVHTWMRLSTLPDSLFVMDDMDRVERSGRANDSSKVSFVYYRYLLSAASLDAVRESVKLRTHTPPWPPPKVYSALTR